MRDYVDSIDKINEVRLLLGHPLYKDKVILFVEGNSDIRLFRNMIQCNEVSIDSVDGKKELLEVMKTLVPDIPERILSICDADFDHLRSKTNEREKYQIFLTDYHDAEMLILSSPSLISFIHEFGSIENSTKLEKELLTNVLEVSYLIGLVRWINMEKKLKLNFRGLSYSRFINVDELSINISTDDMINLLIQRSVNKPDDLNAGKLKAYISTYYDKNACEFQVSCGHDVTNLIALVFRQEWASQQTNMDVRRVESSLRIGYQKDYFCATDLFKKLKSHFDGLGINIAI